MLLQLLLVAAPALAGEEVVETYADGTVKARYTVDEDGKRIGAYQEFHPSGKRKVKATYRKGELSGSYQEYFESGKKALDCKYKKGLLHGKYVEWDEAGDELWICQFAGGVLDGRCDAFEEGKRLVTQVWDEGALVELDGLNPYPRPLDLVRGTVRSLTDDETPLPGSPSEPQVWATPDEVEGQDPGLRAEREKALRALVAYRWLCGVNHEGMRLEEELNRLSTCGARLCDAIGRLDHTPANPGWPSGEYQDGYAGTSRSNLASVPGLLRSVHMYMDDSDPSNIERVGHRKWCLSPGLGRVGFGRHGGYSAMYVAGGGGKGGAAEVMYPPPGYCPTQFFGPRHAWSVDLGRTPQLTKVEIVVRPLDDLYVPEEPLPIDHLSRNGSMLIFRPKGVVVASGKAYLCEIKGLGGNRPLTYMVEFFDLSAAD